MEIRHDRHFYLDADEFLDRHYDKPGANMKLVFQIQALMKKRTDKDKMDRIRLQAQEIKEQQILLL